jgi:hypothetical protein
MDEHEVEDSYQAAFFLANEVVNEYHSFPVVQRADVGGPDAMYIQINGNWFEFKATLITNVDTVAMLEDLALNK